MLALLQLTLYKTQVMVIQAQRWHLPLLLTIYFNAISFMIQQMPNGLVEIDSFSLAVTHLLLFTLNSFLADMDLSSTTLRLFAKLIH
jgi:hypothetical protein